MAESLQVGVGRECVKCAFKEWILSLNIFTNYQCSNGIFIELKICEFNQIFYYNDFFWRSYAFRNDGAIVCFLLNSFLINVSFLIWLHRISCIFVVFWKFLKTLNIAFSSRSRLELVDKAETFEHVDYSVFPPLLFDLLSWHPYLRLSPDPFIFHHLYFAFYFFLFIFPLGFLLFQ